MKKGIDVLQSWRFVLFLMIFVFHLDVFEVVGNSSLYFHAFEGFGCAAVVAYFQLSGFVAALSTKRRLFGEAIVQKYKQFAPLHWVSCAFCLPLHWGILLYTPIIGFGTLALNLALLQSWIPSRQVWLGFNGITWYLSTLLFLSGMASIVKSFVQKINDKFGKAGLVATLVSIFIVQVILATLMRNQDQEIISWVLYAFPPTRLLDYMSGMVVAFLYCGGGQIRHPTSITVGALILFFGSLLLYPYTPYIYTRVALFTPVMIVMLFAILQVNTWLSRVMSNRWLVSMGNLSFPMYMFHQIILQYMERLSRFSIPPFLCVVVAGGATVLTAKMYNSKLTINKVPKCKHQR